MEEGVGLFPLVPDLKEEILPPETRKELDPDGKVEIGKEEGKGEGGDPCDVGDLGERGSAEVFSRKGIEEGEPTKEPPQFPVRAESHRKGQNPFGGQFADSRG
jgi:hypothetical protein